MTKYTVLLTCLVLAVFSPAIALSKTEAITHRMDPQKASRALAGEAGGQSDVELIAHAYALRNRGTLRGVYGLNAPHLAREPKSTFLRAESAWRAALAGGKDPVDGRTEWRSDYDLKLMARRGETPRSAGLCDPIKIGSTTFYRLKK